MVAEAETITEESNHPTPPTNSNGVPRKCIGINGKWYDVKNFIKYHPGGPVIEQFIGKDATDVFEANGHEGVLDKWKPVGTYTMKERHPADVDFIKLRTFFKDQGYFKTDWMFYLKKFIFVYLFLWGIVWSCLIFSSNFYVHILGAFVLAFFWQQSAFLMHDFMHRTVFRTNTFMDRFFGVLLGTVNFGISSHWWREEHIVHHTMTNTFNAETGFADPQMKEVVWAQNTKLFPMFSGYLQWCLIKIQHYTFVPVVTLIGRLDIVTDSYIKERRYYEWIAIVCHWIWMINLLALLPNTKERIIFYAIAAFVEGTFHFQLILSHYCKEVNTWDEFHSDSWFRFQITSNLNLENWRIMDWYYGGLNFHIEHHLYPLMARNKFREASPFIKSVCQKHGIEYDTCTMFQALTRTLAHLKTCASHYKRHFY